MYCFIDKKIISLKKDQTGAVAVEFAILLPVLVTLFIGVIYTINAVNAKTRVSNAAAMVADMVATSRSTNDTELNNQIFRAVDWSMQNTKADQYSAIKVASVISCKQNKNNSYNNITNQQYIVLWSRQRGGATWQTAGSVLSNYPLSSELVGAENDTVIISEFTYKFGEEYGLPSLNMTERRNFRPRTSRRVSLENVPNKFCKDFGL